MLYDLTKPFDISKDQIYVNYFKRYSNVLRDFLDSTQIPGKTMNIHYGSGERIWSKVVRNRENYSIDLPICSFFLKDAKADDESGHNIPPEILFNVAGNVVNSKPQFWKLTYEINYWVKFLKEADTINFEFLGWFSPELYLNVTNSYWKSLTGADYWIDCRVLDHEDAIEQEPGDKEDRVIKINYTIEMDAKLPFLRFGSIEKPIHSIESKVYVDSNLEKKTKEIKDNVKDDDYLESILEYSSKRKTFF